MEDEYWVHRMRKDANKKYKEHCAIEADEKDLFKEVVGFEDVPAGYETLLQEIVPMKPTPTQPLKINPKECCGDAYLNPEGYTVCWNCGKFLSNLASYVYYAPYQREDGFAVNSGVQMAPKRRVYLTKNHFKTHVKRYLGIGMQAPLDEPWMVELSKMIDLENVACYSYVRRFLKQRNLNKYYESIYSIIYQLGGHRPLIDDDILNRVFDEIKCLQTYFYENRSRFGRHNMPCVPHMLSLCLELKGHSPFYTFPGLKDTHRLEKSNEFFKAYVKEIVERRS